MNCCVDGYNGTHQHTTMKIVTNTSQKVKMWKIFQAAFISSFPSAKTKYGKHRRISVQTVLELCCIFHLCYCNNRHCLSLCINDITVLTNSENRSWNSVSTIAYISIHLHIFLEILLPKLLKLWTLIFKVTYIHLHEKHIHTHTRVTNNVAEGRRVDTALCKFKDI
jgi:hypothetical protein